MHEDPKLEEKHLLDILDRLIARAKAAGADAADALIYESVSVATSYRMRRLEDLDRSENGDCGLRVFIGKRQAFVSSTDLSDAALGEIAQRAVDMARIAPEDKFCGLADPALLAKSFADLDLFDPAEPTSEKLVERAKAAEAAALETAGITNSEGASAGWGRGTVALATSDGFKGAYSSSSSSISCSVIAGEGADMQVESEGISKIYGGDLPSPEEIGRTAAARALRALHPRKVKSQSAPVVYENRLAGSFIGQLASAISGAAIARGTSFLKTALGTDIFGPHITIIDDPLRRRGPRSQPFDGEGAAVAPITLIDKGRLTTWILDSASARQLGLQSNGRAGRGTGGPPHPSSTNLHMVAGAMSPKELMADIKSGLYVTSTFGPNVSLVTGDYSVGVSGLWIEDGVPAYPVNEITVAGNLKDMFRNMTQADDLEFRRGVNAPTVRIDGMTVAGT